MQHSFGWNTRLVQTVPTKHATRINQDHIPTQFSRAKGASVASGPAADDNDIYIFCEFANNHMTQL